MITALLSRLVILVFGTLYPAYSSYKAVKTKDLKLYVKWMMYWIVFALFTAAETFTDVFFGFWFPFYHEIKILFVLWLLLPVTKGSSIMYRKVIHPLLLRREQEIDELISKAKDQGYNVILDFGCKSVSLATTAIMNTAVKGGSGLYFNLSKSYSLNDLSTADIRPNNSAVGILRNSSEAINDGALEVTKRDYRYLNDKWMCSLTEKTNIVGITTDSQLSSNVFTNRRRISSCSSTKLSSPVPILSSHVYTLNGTEDNDRSNVTAFHNDDNNYSNICTNQWARKQVGTTSKILENDQLRWSACQQYARPAVPVDDSFMFVQNRDINSLSRLDEYSTTVSKTERFFDASASFDTDTDENTNNSITTRDKRIRNSCPSSFDEYEQMIRANYGHIDDLITTKMALNRRQSMPIRSPALPLIAPSSTCSTNVEPSHVDDKNCPQVELSTPASVDKIVRKKSSTRRKKPLAPKPPSIKPTSSCVDSTVIDGDVSDNGNNSVRM